MSLVLVNDQKFLYPDLRTRLNRAYTEIRRITGKEMRPSETIRSFARQQELYKLGRAQVDGRWVVVDRSKVVTKARPGFSLHAYGLAVDSVWAGADPYLAKEDRHTAYERWELFGRAVRAFGLVWGGDWNGNGTKDPDDFDRPHAQIAYGLQLTELVELYESGGVPAVWATIDKIRNVEVGSEWRNVVDEIRAL